MELNTKQPDGSTSERGYYTLPRLPRKKGYWPWEVPEGPGGSTVCAEADC
jgi:hypothetical protein